MNKLKVLLTVLFSMFCSIFFTVLFMNITSDAFDIDVDSLNVQTMSSVDVSGNN